MLSGLTRAGLGACRRMRMVDSRQQSVNRRMAAFALGEADSESGRMGILGTRSIICLRILGTTALTLRPDSRAKYFSSITLAARLRPFDKLRAGFAGQPKAAVPHGS